jgi:hypothetical protein
MADRDCARTASALRPLRRRAEQRTHVASFDHLICAGEDRLRDRQAERLGGLEIDDQLEPRRALNRQVGRLGTSENPADIDPDLAARASTITKRKSVAFADFAAAAMRAWSGLSASSWGLPSLTSRALAAARSAFSTTLVTKEEFSLTAHSSSDWLGGNQPVCTMASIKAPLNFSLRDPRMRAGLGFIEGDLDRHRRRRLPRPREA